MKNTEIFERMLAYILSRFPDLKGEKFNDKIIFDVDYETFSDKHLETMAQHFGLKVGDFGNDIVPHHDPEDNFMYVYLFSGKLHLYRDHDMRKHYQ